MLIAAMTGVKISDEQMRQLRLRKHRVCLNGITLSSLAKTRISFCTSSMAGTRGEFKSIRE